MPLTAPIAVDKDQVRMLVMSIGVRPAARKLGIPEPTVQAWAARGKWLAATRPVQPPVIPATMPPPATMLRQATVATMQPADALASVMAEHGQATRLALAWAARNAAEHAQSLDGEDSLNQAPNLHSTAKTAALVHNWGTATPAVRISIYDGDRQAQAIEIESSVEPVPDE